MTPDRDLRVLVLAPRGRDSAVIAQTLIDRAVHVCADVAELERETQLGTGTVVVTEETLDGQALDGLKRWLADQPPWSDLPFVLLAAQRLAPRPSAAQQTLSDLGNIVILERPVDSETLQRAVASALRARSRQYNAREHLEERRQFASTLETKINERTAELAEANAHLVREIEEKGRMQSFLVQSQKMEAVGQLTGGVAHDFNNLLTVIRSCVDFLRRSDVPPDRRERYIDAIAQTVDRATKLTGQLLAYARRQSLVPVEFDVCAQVRIVTDLLAPIVGARIHIDLALPTEPLYALADTSQFETALINLAVNARDAMHGEGTLGVRVQAVNEVPSVRGHAGGKGAFVLVTVHDTGCGIDPDHLANIFEPFFTTKEVGKGTGLGLSQVFGFAKQSGGEVSVRSEEGSGATFELYLPQTTGARLDANKAVAVGSTASPAQKGLRVLVVEDNDAIGQFAVEMLSDLGHKPVRAINAQDALDALGSDAAEFDAVFSDVMMPGMNGLAMAQLVRERFASLPILLTSGYSHIVAQEGTHGFELLKKPYSVEALAQRLQQVVSAAA